MTRVRTRQKYSGAFNYVMDCFSREGFISLGVSSIYFWLCLFSLNFCHSKVLLGFDGEFLQEISEK